jgi:hypothetical protein
MKTVINCAFFLSILLFISCNGKKEQAISSSVPNEKITKAEVTQVVINYLKNKFKDPIISENEGLTRIQGYMETAIFKQDRIFIGKLDSDETQDAIVTYGYQKTGSMAYDRHLIILNKDSLRVINDFPEVMKIEEISSGKVIATKDTTPKKLDTQPCPSCIVMIKLKLQGDSLVLEKQ